MSMTKQSMILSFTPLAESEGDSPRMSAANPATCGAENDVPEPALANLPPLNVVEGASP